MSACEGCCFTGDTPRSKPRSRVGKSEEGKTPHVTLPRHPCSVQERRYLRRPPLGWSSVKPGWDGVMIPRRRATLLCVARAALCLAGGTEGSARCRASSLPPVGLPAPNPEARVTLSYSYRASSCSRSTIKGFQCVFHRLLIYSSQLPCKISKSHYLIIEMGKD